MKINVRFYGFLISIIRLFSLSFSLSPFSIHTVVGEYTPDDCAMRRGKLFKYTQLHIHIHTLIIFKLHVATIRKTENYESQQNDTAFSDRICDHEDSKCRRKYRVSKEKRPLISFPSLKSITQFCIQPPR